MQDFVEFLGGKTRCMLSIDDQHLTMQDLSTGVCGTAYSEFFMDGVHNDGSHNVIGDNIWNWHETDDYTQSLMNSKVARSGVVLEELVVSMIFPGPELGIPNFDTRLPPMKTLALCHYPWCHSAADVTRIWDFSRLERLTLNQVDLFKFLQTVPPKCLGNLRKLYILEPRLSGDQTIVRTHLTALYRELKMLSVLKLVGDWRNLAYFGTDLGNLGTNIRSTASRLHKLELRTVVCDPRGWASPAYLTGHELQSLNRGFPNLKTLSLDYSLVKLLCHVSTPWPVAQMSITIF